MGNYIVADKQNINLQWKSSEKKKLGLNIQDFYNLNTRKGVSCKPVHLVCIDWYEITLKHFQTPQFHRNAFITSFFYQINLFLDLLTMNSTDEVNKFKNNHFDFLIWVFLKIYNAFGGNGFSPELAIIIGLKAFVPLCGMISNGSLVLVTALNKYICIYYL